MAKNDWRPVAVPFKGSGTGVRGGAFGWHGALVGTLKRAQTSGSASRSAAAKKAWRSRKRG